MLKVVLEIIISYLARGDLSSADILYKQIAPRSAGTECQFLSGSKTYDTLMVFLKDFFKEFRRRQYKHAKSPSMQTIKIYAAYTISEIGENALQG